MLCSGSFYAKLMPALCNVCLSCKAGEAEPAKEQTINTKQPWQDTSLDNEETDGQEGTKT
jgi:hypothetical protein